MFKQTHTFFIRKIIIKMKHVFVKSKCLNKPIDFNKTRIFISNNIRGRYLVAEPLENKGIHF
jgi:hypothetical protein